MECCVWSPLVLVGGTVFQNLRFWRYCLLNLSGLCVGVQGRKSKGTTGILALGIGLITGDETIQNCEEDRKYG